jgi:hypothetical protein
MGVPDFAPYYEQGSTARVNANPSNTMLAVNTGGSSSKINGGSAESNNAAEGDQVIHGAIDEWISSSSSPAAMADQPVKAHDQSEPDHHENCGKNRNPINSNSGNHHDDGSGGDADADAAAAADDDDQDHDAGDRDRLMAVASNSQKTADDDLKPSAGN